jgi:hypothetical protein
VARSIWVIIKLAKEVPKMSKLPKMPKVEEFYRFYKKKKAGYATILICWLLIFQDENIRHL